MARKELAINGGDPVRDKFLVFGNPIIEKEEIEEVVASLKSGWIGTGPKVEKFENIFKEYVGSKFAIALNSCTAGLHLSLIVSGIQKGDEVITSPMTFCATANSIFHVGAKPIFVDIEKESMNIDPEKIKSVLTKKTKAIIPVHFAGRPCNMDAILEIAKENNLIVIEDAAHCIEGYYKEKKIGNIGNLTCFSFYVTKNIVTGEGGMVTTNNEEWADKIKMYGLHGLSRDAWKRYSDEGFKHYEVTFPGFKYNMMDLQASIGIHQMKRINKYLIKRNKIWKKYDDAFKDLPVSLPPKPENKTIHARHLYTLILDIDRLKVDRDTVQKALQKENIGTGIHFISLHLHKYYRETFGFHIKDFPNAKYISERTISLPLSAKLTDKDIDDVTLAVRRVLEWYSK
ncbi:MAG: UDP-4-amino-4,6-dideoxy-N-acetyl-beta-L-altrosamine transaminase [Candidatus Schekmanbacteria bacterium RIFCSPHIGHO2_02_FULL_38_11]|uniref:UDP-4-amino-4, 6-dideoxy-N-acetyl-beta-L-altrosamine transaminase n=1 Tax=Candidatus Schekmanbacteria bacterium RIFCSPLOWO2_12_FULL_38_15 TaxID=1817883 RepID=A0A1F7SN14_9BACT|nr:MAG: UDP-4-amino-4,6-dideoxy-N-acetyl-beta-L-altrosamine transaminase [Candidatus Schekmanbacteria bacterium GWA2_38_9]OGL50048.1 MAG: UDP-4-amino-4,6-dideoxy-N-acetyl-beta-L-altrosamine transaminase [Candidatus Schekmanbacteria bacterium RIFCSPHIGHO2_02_FULL_38_11]OGL51165.1 MAG: UDP-4-amino-4,6-dideoxy-N-acetyl-beta-L-altrosamine transaminase [Candidatus Schekmanbacteria bacterium RIFCSPLOWO2_02_FULL_38_14]OGL55165.1 MAG: UDP-4-amino-4,6-dideoxy-N-acetyl-beta-L-altrosamine transaminase [Can